MKAMASNNWQLEIRMRGTSAEDVIEATEKRLKQINEIAKKNKNGDYPIFQSAQSGMLNHAFGTVVLFNHPGFQWNESGSLFYAWLCQTFYPGFDPEDDYEFDYNFDPGAHQTE